MGEGFRKRIIEADDVENLPRSVCESSWAVTSVIVISILIVVDMTSTTINVEMIPIALLTLTPLVIHLCPMHIKIP